MRILAVTNLYPNPFHPIRATFNREQFRALARDHAVQVISPILWTDELSARLRGHRPLPNGRRVEFDGLTVDHPRYWYPPKLLRTRYGHCFRAGIRRTFERAVDEFDPDVVLAAWAYPDGWAAASLARQAGLPVAVKVHGSDLLWGLRHYPARVRRTRDALRAADLVVAVSQDLANKVEEFGVRPDRIRVVYDGVDLDSFCPGPRAEARTRLGLPHDVPNLLFVGSLVPVKGLRTLIAACESMARAGRRFRCHLIGGGPLRESLARQAAAVGLSDSVVFHGPKAHASLPDWFRAADLFVLPSQSEGVPCVLLEAMACGTRFVASRVGGIPEVARFGSGELATPGDAAGLAEAISRQLGDRSAPGVRWTRGHAQAAADIASGLQRMVASANRPMPLAV